MIEVVAGGSFADGDETRDASPPQALRKTVRTSARAPA
jgi:hypothetical protein